MGTPPWILAVDPLLALGCAAVAAVVAWSLTGARAGGGAWRRTGGAAAVALLAVAWLSPLQTLASGYLLSAHLAQVLLVIGVVPPLLLLALPERAAVAPPRWLRRVGRGLTHPVTGMVAINAVFFVWHVGPAYDAALRSAQLYAAEQASLLLVSVMFWWPIVVPCGGRHVLSRWGKLGYILVATIPQTFAGITVALAKHPLYAGYQAAPRVFGLGVMTDQVIAGACLALVSKLALFAAFAVVFMRLLNESPADGGDDGGGGWRRPGADTPSPQPAGTLEWLADLNAGRTVPEPVPVPARTRLSSRAGAGSARE